MGPSDAQVSLAIFRERSGKFYWPALPFVHSATWWLEMRALLGPMAGVTRVARHSLGSSLALKYASQARYYSANNVWRQIGYFLRPPAPPAGFVPPPRGEVMAGKLIGAVCFFWMFYIFRKDGAAIFVSPASWRRA